MMRRLFGILFLLALSSPVSWAHEGSAHVMGTVTEIAADHVVVQTTDAKTVTIKTTAKTSYRTTKEASSRDALKVGHRVVAEVTKDATGMTASELRFSSVPPKPGAR